MTTDIADMFLEGAAAMVGIWSGILLWMMGRCWKRDESLGRGLRFAAVGCIAVGVIAAAGGGVILAVRVSAVIV